MEEVRQGFVQEVFLELMSQLILKWKSPKVGKGISDKAKACFSPLSPFPTPTHYL